MTDRQLVADPLRPAVWLLSLLLAASLQASPSEPPPAETDSPWRLQESDAGARVIRQLRVYDQGRSPSGCHYLQLAAAYGETAYLVHPVSPSMVVDELSASVWVKADRPGAQLMLRVVLPASRDPRTGKPLTTLLRGTSYDQTGGWQQLDVRNSRRLLEKNVWMMRTEFPEVDPRGAYIDLVVLNAYTRSGITQLWIDDVELSGVVELQGTGLPPAAGGDQALAGRPVERVRVEGPLIEANSQPLFARMIDHNGESFEWLQSLGFNAVRLRLPPTEAQLRQAQQLRIWIVAPPPGQGGITNAHGRVLAWDLGSQLGGWEVEAVEQLARQLRQQDPLQRPLVGSPAAQVRRYSRILDILELEAPATGLRLPELADGLRRRQRLARDGTPIWVRVPTQFSPTVLDQLDAFGALHSREPWGLDPDLVRSVAIEAVAAGARGLHFRSHTPLDARDRATELRVRVLEALNHELALVEPWAAAGSYVDELATANDQTRASVLQTERAQLVLVRRRVADDGQFVMPPAPKARESLTVYGPGATTEAYHVSAGALRRLPADRSRGFPLTLEGPASVEMVVLTHTPLVVAFLQQRLRESAGRSAQLRYEIAERWLQWNQSLLERLPAAEPASGGLEQAAAHLRQCAYRLATGDYPEAHAQADQAMSAIAGQRQRVWQQAVGGAAPTTSPFWTAPEMLAGHWQLARQLVESVWSGNLLGGGDMEDLDRMRALGWQQLRDDSLPVHSDVTLSYAHAMAGRSALRIRCWSDQALSNALEGPAVWITSAPVPVAAGQLVRIEGWVNVPRPIDGDHPGLVVFDSWGGTQLAQQFRHTRGWQRFTLYRAAPQSGDVTVTFALWGLGEALVDDVRVSLLERPASR